MSCSTTQEILVFNATLGYTHEDGTLYSIDVDKTHTQIWGVGGQQPAGGNVYQWDTNALVWNYRGDACATRLYVDRTGAYVYALLQIGAAAAGGPFGHAVSQWHTTGSGWATQNYGGLWVGGKITNGTWVLSGDKTVWFFNGTSFVNKTPANLTCVRIDACADGSAIAQFRDSNQNLAGIYYSNQGAAFVKLTGSFSNNPALLGASTNANMYAIILQTSLGQESWALNSGKTGLVLTTNQPSLGSDGIDEVSACDDGTLYGVGTSGNVYKYSGGTGGVWTKTTTNPLATDVAGSSSSTAWGLNTNVLCPPNTLNQAPMFVWLQNTRSTMYVSGLDGDTSASAFMKNYSSVIAKVAADGNTSRLPYSTYDSMVHDYATHVTNGGLNLIYRQPTTGAGFVPWTTNNTPPTTTNVQFILTGSVPVLKLLFNNFGIGTPSFNNGNGWLDYVLIYGYGTPNIASGLSKVINSALIPVVSSLESSVDAHTDYPQLPASVINPTVNITCVLASLLNCLLDVCIADAQFQDPSVIEELWQTLAMQASMAMINATIAHNNSYNGTWANLGNW